MRGTISLIGVMSMLALAAGCQTDPGRDRSKATVNTIQGTRAEMAAGIGEIEAVQATLIAFQNAAGDQSKLYDTYKKQVAAVEARGTRVAAEADNMSRRSQEYRDAWREEAGQISDPALREAAQARAATVNDRFQGIFEKYRTAKDAYRPFVTQLKDVQKYLSNDLTAAGVKAATPTLKEAVKLGDELKVKTQAVISELDTAATRLTPAIVPQ